MLREVLEETTDLLGWEGEKNVGEIFVIFLCAIVQGLTEFLPISSSGHLLLIQHFQKGFVGDSVFLYVTLHMGTLVTILLTYWKVILKLASETVHLISDLVKRRYTNSYHRKLLTLLATSSAPLLITFIFRKQYKQVMNLSNIVLLGVFFLFTATIVWFSGKKIQGSKSAAEMRYADALLIGLAQALIAPLPGISRSGITIAVGLVLGLSIKYCIMYSFLLSIPTILAAELVNVSESTSQIGRGDWWLLPVAVLISVIVGCICVNILEKAIRKNKFRLFAYYTAFVGTFAIAIGTLEHLNIL
ncbi:MAG: undecaprenyl-diphosphate phosphatase [Oscillospiraceae bacterium]|jgi:undecaprenyl-diphosphatase|nr:undecaprenyl-diphosphate phosphatase [Oscillospiraceae bacterium]